MTGTIARSSASPDRLLSDAGFTLVRDGEDGSLVWERPGVAGCRIWISDGDGEAPPARADQPTLVCVYTGGDDDPEGFFCAVAPDLESALAAVRDGRVPRRVRPGDEILANFAAPRPCPPHLKLVVSRPR